MRKQKFLTLPLSANKLSSIRQYDTTSKNRENKENSVSNEKDEAEEDEEVVPSVSMIPALI